MELATAREREVAGARAVLSAMCGRSGLYRKPPAGRRFGADATSLAGALAGNLEVDGVAPTADTIADGSYPLARSLYIYVKKQHIGVIPGLQQFVQEFMSDGSAGRGGYLQDRGLVPLPADQLTAERGKVQAMTAMTRPQ